MEMPNACETIERLARENERLKLENRVLNSELAELRKDVDEIFAMLTAYMKRLRALEKQENQE